MVGSIELDWKKSSLSSLSREKMGHGGGGGCKVGWIWLVILEKRLGLILNEIEIVPNERIFYLYTCRSKFRKVCWMAIFVGWKGTITHVFYEKKVPIVIALGITCLHTPQAQLVGFATNFKWCSPYSSINPIHNYTDYYYTLYINYIDTIYIYIYTSPDSFQSINIYTSGMIWWCRCLFYWYTLWKSPHFPTFQPPDLLRCSQGGTWVAE